MDLMNLRDFIDGQKLRLEQERQALLSKRRAIAENTNNFPSTRISVDDCTTTESEDAVSAIQVADALCDRIKKLNSFKNDVLPHAWEKDLKEPSVNACASDTKPAERVCAADLQNQPDKFRSSEPNNNGSEVSPDYKVQKIGGEPGVQEESALLENGPIITLKEKPPVHCTLHSREQEVERLQEKLSAVSFWDEFGRSATSKKWKSEATEKMVRVGEFSPANPELQAPGKALIGLGEYEERRRLLLERKKQEYKEYLSQPRILLQRTEHLQHPSLRSIESSNLHHNVGKESEMEISTSISGVDVATQTDSWLLEQSLKEIKGNHSSPTQSTSLSPPGESSLQALSPRVPRAHSSQTTEQLPDARSRQLQLQEELRLQIEEKRRLEAERREREQKEEEALQKRVAEQQARLQAEYERDEKLRREREIQKQLQIEEFQRRQEELRAESEALKLEQRRLKLEASDVCCPKSESSKPSQLLPPSEPAPLSILKNSSPLHSPRRAAHSVPEPTSPRALVRVLEAPSFPKADLADTLPIPLMPVDSQRPHRSPCGSPRISPHHSPPCGRSPGRSPHRLPHSSAQCNPSPQRVAPRRVTTHRSAGGDWQNTRAKDKLSNPPVPAREPSEAMRNLEERWKVPAVQKNICVRGNPNVQNSMGNVLTQLGAFRRQLQMEHMRMEEKVREQHHPHQYHQKLYQQHNSQRMHPN